jgi:hypothetical protein
LDDLLHGLVLLLDHTRLHGLLSAVCCCELRLCLLLLLLQSSLQLCHVILSLFELLVAPGQSCQELVCTQGLPTLQMAATPSFIVSR